MGWKLLTDMTKCCVTISTPHTSYKEWKYTWVQIDTKYDLIKNVLLCHIRHIRNGDICRTGKRSHEFILNLDQIESFFWCTTYINTCDYKCNRHLKTNYIIYNAQFDIYNHNKTPSCVKLHSFQKRVWIKLNDQELDKWV